MKLTKNKRFKVRIEIKKFAYLPIIYRGSLFWLSKIKIEKSFNGMSMRIINVQRV
ncbi:hypothetical protein [Tenacibaculum jejuense]|uniref:Uncharacterized protein n=1 Tax=Tenacibaculum jejuense TaxID=584609 RepID=A0A238U7Y1_9FLAO|nr:hypothetical protein [Tenacibaculum jejuense]SNR15291.1 Protein of unknown function [Tenacibaculum jejuense]